MWDKKKTLLIKKIGCKMYDNEIGTYQKTINALYIVILYFNVMLMVKWIFGFYTYKIIYDDLMGKNN